jgi:signal transduction histidine kinase/DNA-binding response OmpR family regulator
MSASFIGKSDRIRGLDGGADAYLVEPVEPTELVATVRALLRMREAERGLRVAAQEWSETFDAIGDPIALVDHDGQIRRSNRSFSEIFTSDEEAAGRSILDVVEVGDGVAFSSLFHSTARRALELPIGDRQYKVEFNPLLTRGLTGGVILFDDVTDERRIEGERQTYLRREKEARNLAEISRARSEFLSQASALVAASLSDEEIPAGVARLCTNGFADWCFVDRVAADGEITMAAISARNPTGAAEARQAHVLALRALEATHPLARVLKNGATIVIPQPEGTKAELPHDLQRVGAGSMITVALRARGRTIGAITVVREVTSPEYDSSDVAMFEDLAQRVALAMENARLFREAQDANHAKDEFLATLSHELRTPLTATLGWAKMLRMGGLDGETFDSALETIQRSTEVQSQIIEDILDVSRIVTGKLAVDMRPVDFASVITNAIESLRPSAEAKRLRIEQEIENEIPLNGDPRRLQQIVWNLLSNAIKFTPEEGTVFVSYRRAGDRSRLEIRDSGQGIAPEFLPHVFERFRQADGASTREHGGLGLGLAIVRHLVELHRGKIRAESPGLQQGASFIVEIPLARGDEPATTDEASIAKLPDLQGLRVLILEDQADTREWISAVLRRSGAEVQGVETVREALRLMEEWQPTMVVSDLALPDDDGVEFARRVREGDGINELPMLALSAYARAEDRERALQAGFSSYLQKPLDPARLAAEVARLSRR